MTIVTPGATVAETPSRSAPSGSAELGVSLNHTPAVRGDSASDTNTSQQANDDVNCGRAEGYVGGENDKSDRTVIAVPDSRREDHAHYRSTNNPCEDDPDHNGDSFHPMRILRRPPPGGRKVIH